jgi:hypothetical protein
MPKRAHAKLIAILTVYGIVKKVQRHKVVNLVDVVRQVVKVDVDRLHVMIQRVLND